MSMKQKANLVWAVHKIVTDTDRDYFMTAEEAVEYCLVDEIMIKAIGC